VRFQVLLLHLILSVLSPTLLSVPLLRRGLFLFFFSIPFSSINSSSSRLDSATTSVFFSPFFLLNFLFLGAC